MRSLAKYLIIAGAAIGAIGLSLHLAGFFTLGYVLFLCSSVPASLGIGIAIFNFIEQLLKPMTPYQAWNNWDGKASPITSANHLRQKEHREATEWIGMRPDGVSMRIRQVRYSSETH
jgi:hypothetical protein